MFNRKATKSHKQHSLLVGDCSRKILRLAVDYEQNAGNQRADSRDDAQYSTDTYTKKAQAHDY